MIQFLYTFEWSSYETLVLTSIFEGVAPDEGEEGIGEEGRNERDAENMLSVVLLYTSI